MCYRLRMEHAARYAAANGFDWFCSTLSISPRKDAEKINAIGRELEAKYGVRHLPNEFKRKEGHKRSLELSAEYGLYRQDWCGCEFGPGQRPKAGAARPGKITASTSPRPAPAAGAGLFCAVPLPRREKPAFFRHFTLGRPGPTWATI